MWVQVTELGKALVREPEQVPAQVLAQVLAQEYFRRKSAAQSHPLGQELKKLAEPRLEPLSRVES